MIRPVRDSEDSATPKNGSNASTPDDVTRWLARWADGDADALDAILPTVYDELRAVARRIRRRERPGHTLATTALVHEAYVRLARRRSLDAANRHELLALAGLAMRRILVDHARARLREKRGAGQEPLPLDAVDIRLPITNHQAEELLDVDRCLRRLTDVDRRAAWVVQQRVFVGSTLEELAADLGVSRKTVQRDWAAGIAWLRQEVRATRSDP